MTATVASSSQINLSWTASTDNVGVTGYLVERCSGASCTTFAQIATPTTTTYSDTGLAASTSYSYRVRATDAAGNLSGYSNTASGTTQAGSTATPSITSFTPSSGPIGTAISVTGSGFTGATYAKVSYVTDAGLTVASDTQATITVPADAPLGAATIAIANASHIGYSSGKFTVTSADTTPPTAPTGLTATVASSTQINLSWTASTDNVGVTGYLVERCSGASCTTFAQIATPTTTTYSDTGLAASTSYSYRVRATDAAGNLSVYSNIASGTTQASGDTTPPTAPTGLTAVAASASQINLGWTASTDNVGVTGYRVERCAGASCTTFAQVATPTTTTYSDTGLTASTSYSYRVRATDAAGNLSGYSNIATTATPAAPQAPTAPATLSANPVATTQVNLSWGASTDTVGVTGYLLERCTGAGCSSFAQVASVAGTSTSYGDTGLTSASIYSYRIRATDAAGLLSGYSPVATATTPIGSGVSGSVTYGYDALGRLVQVAAPTLSSVQAMTYDASGNINSTASSAITGLSIENLSVSQAGPGEQFTVDGSGFSSTASADTVTINGVAATVVSATSTELVVMVPTNATSGVVKVTVGGVTASSTQTFQVNPADVTPTITSFSPVLAGPGATLSLVGSAFDPIAANDSFQFGSGGWEPAATATATSATVTVPASAWSGKMGVLTLYGGYSSGADDFFFPPTGYTATTIGSTGRITVGSQVALSLPTAGLSALRIFQGSEGESISIGASADSIASSTVKVYGPTGTLLTSGVITGNGQGFAVPVLPAAGTYALLVDPGSNTGNITVVAAPPLQSSLSIGGAATTITLATPAQTAAVTFTGTAGSFITLTLSAVTIASGTITLLSPTGAILLTSAFTSSGISFQPEIPVSGTYTLQIVPTGSTAGSYQLAGTVSATPTLAATQNNTVTISAGLTFTRTFEAIQGQYVSLALGGNETTGAGSSNVSYSVTQPDGSTFCSGTFAVTWDAGANTIYNGGGECDFAPVKEGGTYQLQITEVGVPYEGEPAVTSVLVFVALSTPVQVAPALNPTQAATSVSLNVPGQGAMLTFAGTAGQHPSLALAQTTYASGVFFYSTSEITLIGPDGVIVNSNPIALTAASASYGQWLVLAADFGTLPLTGTYTVFFDPQTPATGAINFTLSLPVAGGGISFNGANNDIAVTRQGQGFTATFTGALNQAVSIETLNQTTGACLCDPTTAGTFTVISPSGTVIPLGPSNASLPPLTEAGTYTIEFVQTGTEYGAGAGIGTWDVIGLPNVTGSLVVNGPAVYIQTVYTPYQLTIPATAGEALTITMAVVGGDVFFGNAWLFAPNGATVWQGPVSFEPPNPNCTTVCLVPFTFSTAALPLTGNYTLVLQTTGGTLSFQVTSP